MGEPLAREHMPNGLITYDGLPISSGGGHRLRARGIERAWEAMGRFLDRCTTGSLASPATTVTVDVFEGARIDPAVSAPARARFAELARGPERTSRIRAPSGGEMETMSQFRIPPENRESAIAVLAAGEPWPAHYYGPVVLIAELRFHLKDPRTDAVLPGQGADRYGRQRFGSGGWLGESNLKLTLSGALRAACIWLSFPMAEPDAGFRELVAAMQGELPFQLSAKHWRRWRPRQRGEGLASHPFRLER